MKIHETVYIDEGSIIGEETAIWHFSHILEDVEIGKNCSIGQNCVIGPHVKIGDGCRIQNNVSIYHGVTIEDDVFIGPSAVFTNVINPRAFRSRKNEFRQTLIKKGASLGANCTIVCGVIIGEYALIGAGAVISKDVEPHAVMVGNPSRKIGYVCNCGFKHSLELFRKCNECGYEWPE